MVPLQLHLTSFLHACAQALAARFPSSAPPDKPEAGPEGDPEAPPPEPGPEDEPGEEEAGLPGWGGFKVRSSSSSSTEVRRRRSKGRSRARADRLDGFLTMNYFFCKFGWYFNLPECSPGTIPTARSIWQPCPCDRPSEVSRNSETESTVAKLKKKEKTSLFMSKKSSELLAITFWRGFEGWPSRWRRRRKISVTVCFCVGNSLFCRFCRLENAGF